MLILTCPYCGVTAEETEFQGGGEAHLTRYGPGTSDDDFENYLFMRENFNYTFAFVDTNSFL